MIVKRALVPENLLAPVRSWALASYRGFPPNQAGPGRYYGRVEPPQEIYDLVMDAFGVPRDAPIEPLLGHYVGVNEPGAFIHLHTDIPVEHTRFNVCVSSGIAEAIHGDYRFIPVPGDVWRCEAGRVVHGTTPARSHRIVLSLGFHL